MILTHCVLVFKRKSTGSVFRHCICYDTGWHFYGLVAMCRPGDDWLFVNEICMEENKLRECARQFLDEPWPVEV